MKKMNREDIKEVVEYMNDKYTSNFKYKARGVQVPLGRLLSNYSVQQIKDGLDNRYDAWICEPVMHKYFRPSTIFKASNFSKYFDETYN